MLVEGALVAIALGALGVVRSHNRSLARGLHAAKLHARTLYLFPPPEQLRVATLGYRAAVVDMLWVKLRIENGIHLLEKRSPSQTRPTTSTPCSKLEPDFPPAFKYVDSMLCYREGSGEREARLTRAYLERGIAARPNDHEVWLRYGQFLAFMGGAS